MSALHAEGLSGAEIARQLDVTRSTVAYHLRNLGHAPDPKFSRRHDWAEVQAFHDAGSSARECMLRFGMSAKTWHDARRRGDLVTRPAAMPIDQLLSARRGRGHLKQRLWAAGLKPRHCERCELSEWLGAPLCLELHHKNGNGQDNALENLEILCPNCHSQTDTWGGRNRLSA